MEYHAAAEVDPPEHEGTPRDAVADLILDEIQRLLGENHRSLSAQRARAEIVMRLAESRAWLVRPDAPHGTAVPVTPAGADT